MSSPPSAPLPSAPFSHFGAWVAVWSPHLWQNVTISACFTEKKANLAHLGSLLDLTTWNFGTTSFSKHRQTLGHLGMFQICGVLWHLAPTPLVSQHSLWCSISTSTARVQTTIVHLFTNSWTTATSKPCHICHILSCPAKTAQPTGSSRSWHITPASKPEAHTNWPLIVDQWPRPDARFCSFLLHCQSCWKQSPWASCCKGTSTENPNSRLPRWHWPSTVFSL